MYATNDQSGVTFVDTNGTTSALRPATDTISKDDQIADLLVEANRWWTANQYAQHQLDALSQQRQQADQTALDANRARVQAEAKAEWATTAMDRAITDRQTIRALAVTAITLSSFTLAVALFTLLTAAI